MKQELIWLLLVMGGVVVALFSSRMMRTVVREVLVHPKQHCKIEKTKNRVRVTRQRKPELEEVQDGRS